MSGRGRKALTMRKLHNRGRTPIRYRTKADGVRHGWIVKRGRILLHVYLIGVGRRRLRPDEQRYVTELSS